MKKLEWIIKNVWALEVYLPTLEVFMMFMWHSWKYGLIEYYTIFLMMTFASDLVEFLSWKCLHGDHRISFALVFKPISRTTSRCGNSWDSRETLGIIRDYIRVYIYILYYTM